MKKYIASSIAAFLALIAQVGLGITTETATLQYIKNETTCQQSNQGVIVCPGCQGKGNIGGQKCQRCQGRGILKSNGMPL